MFFILLPYAVDVPFDRRPFVNWALVISVMAAFLFQIPAMTGVESSIEAIKPFVLDGWDVQGLFGHMWLHADPIHLGGNMLFLWIFGNAVCAKVGNFKFLPLYLLLGLIAAAAHLLLNGEPAVGASGAINGVVGMFLIFFWQNEMDMVFLGMFMLQPVHRTFSIPSYWMIVLWLLFDIWGATVGGGQVAYFAHLGGFFAGMVFAILLIKLKLVTMYRDEQSLVGYFEQWRQDQQDKKLVRIARNAIDQAQAQGVAVNDGNGRDEPAEIASPVAAPKQPAILRFACPCGRQIKVPIQQAGKTGRCPQCRQKIVVPIPTAEEL